MSWAWFMILLGVLLMLSVDSEMNAADDELDPFDMVNFDHVQMKMKKKPVEQPGDEEAIPEVQALAVAEVRTVLKPMRTIGTEISEFICALNKDLPTPLQCLIIGLAFLFFFLLLIFSCGYKCTILTFMVIEPSDNSGDVRTMREKVRDLRARVEGNGPSGSSSHRPALRPSASASAPVVQQISSSNITASQSQPETVRALPPSPSPETLAIEGEDGQETDHSVLQPDEDGRSEDFPLSRKRKVKIRDRVTSSTTGCGGGN